MLTVGRAIHLALAAEAQLRWTSMRVIPVELGFSVADGEQVDLSFSRAELVVRFIDWRENQVEHRFGETLAFRWSARPTIPMPREDSTFEVLESSWLADEVRLEGYAELEEFAHYVLCFNAEKILEVISRRS